MMYDGTVLYLGGQSILTTPIGALRYGLCALDLSIQLGVDDPLAAHALDMTIGPNLSSGSARVHLTLPHASAVRMSVFDLQGREVARLADGWLAAGAREITWDGRTASGRRESGVYFVKAEAAGRAITKRLVVFR